MYSEYLVSGFCCVAANRITSRSHLLPSALARFEDGADDFGRLAPIGVALAQIAPVHPGQVALPILIHHAPHLC